MCFPVMYLGTVLVVGSRQVEGCSASLKAFILLSSVTSNVTPDFLALAGFSHWCYFTGSISYRLAFLLSAKDQFGYHHRVRLGPSWVYKCPG